MLIQYKRKLEPVSDLASAVDVLNSLVWTLGEPVVVPYRTGQGTSSVVVASGRLEGASGPGAYQIMSCTGFPVFTKVTTVVPESITDGSVYLYGDSLTGNQVFLYGSR